jgi:hypothetical protein
MQGKVVEARPQALQKRKDSKYAVALDSEQNTIQKKDIVKVIDGPHAVSNLSEIKRSILFQFAMIWVQIQSIAVNTRFLCAVFNGAGSIFLQCGDICPMQQIYCSNSYKSSELMGGEW